MKIRNCIALLSVINCVCFPVLAQSIGWTTVTPGNMQWGAAPSTGATFTPIGPMVYGSDGSSSYQSGGTTNQSDGRSAYGTGGATVHSDGTRTQLIGETLFGERPDGSQFYCRRQSGQVVCKPR